MSESYQLIILPEAQNDIRSIILYIAKELAAPQAALDLQEDIQRAIESLSVMPERISVVEEAPWHEAGIRKTRVKNYYIYYLIDHLVMSVKVLAVIYIGRDQAKQMTERRMEEM